MLVQQFTSQWRETPAPSLPSQRNDRCRLTGTRTAVREQLLGSVLSGSGSRPSPLAMPAAAPAAGTSTIPFCRQGSEARGPKCPSRRVREQGSEHRQLDPGPERQTQPSAPHAGGEQPPCRGARVKWGTLTQAPALQSTRTDKPHHLASQTAPLSLISRH